MTGVTTQPWQKSSANGIGYSDPHFVLLANINLSFFDDTKLANGSTCFGGITPILAGNIRKRRGAAEANLWIEGLTQDGNSTVFYILEMFGRFENPDDWLTVASDIEMTDWEWKVANGQADLENFSCRGGDLFQDDEQFINIAPQ